jgi:hypothetical protein
LTLPGGRVVVIEPFFPPSVTSNLDGTYVLTRITADFVGGALWDTETGTITATGTMVISGNRITQSIDLIVNGSPLYLSASGTFTDYGSYIVVVQDGGTTRASLIVREGGRIVTETISGADGGRPPATEIDQWALVSSATPTDTASKIAAAKRRPPGQSGIATAPPGAVGAVLTTAAQPRT